VHRFGTSPVRERRGQAAAPRSTGVWGRMLGDRRIGKQWPRSDLIELLGSVHVSRRSLDRRVVLDRDILKS
jgi:hypothetical protein